MKIERVKLCETSADVYIDVKLYSEKEMKLLYLLDPLEFASYVQEYAKHVYSNLSDIVDFKD